MKLVVTADYEESLARLVRGDADAAALNYHVGAVLAARLYPGQVTMPRIFFNQTPVGLGVFEVRYSPLTDERDNVLGVIGVATDITENRRAEVSIRESEERYRELFENANDIIYTHDLQGNFTSLNRTGERITGYIA